MSGYGSSALVEKTSTSLILRQIEQLCAWLTRYQFPAQRTGRRDLRTK